MVMLDKQRGSEAAVARTMADMLITNCTSSTEIVPQDILAHHFGLACNDLNFVPDEAAARRILHNVARELSEHRRAADRFNNFLQREAKRSRQS